jgi:hypothetical protein
VLSLVMNTEYLELGMLPNVAVENRLLGFPPKPNWWPVDVKDAADTVFVFVGMKPIEHEIGHMHWLQELPEKERNWIEQPRTLTLPLMK